jgi:hypothetical protein
VHGLERQALGLGSSLGERLAAHVEGYSADKLEEAGAARVDHTGLPKDRQLLRRPRERLLTRVDDLRERLSCLESFVVGLLRTARERARHGQDRPLLWLAHRGVTGVCGGTKHGCLILSSRKCLCGPAKDLREDHPRVAARSHEAGTDGHARHLLVPRRIRGVKRVPNRPGGQRHVRARIPVGHGEDVQVVDPLAAGLERSQGCSDKLPRGG